MDKRTVDPADVPALLRAALAGDMQGALVILDNVDLLELALALCGFMNQQGTAVMDGNRERWDAALADVQRQMSGL
ncbi:hypothetical protein ACFYPC_20330 [Streptomyces sp. NPDC005808]|uniref:hypothetical protein n=1 Tax=Streptomyces sp. NPDC005808 TaxID=3364734 RepID=UPI0036ACEE8E